MANEMSSSERSLYNATGLLRDLLPHLEQQGVFAVPVSDVAKRVEAYFDEMGKHYGWPEDWRQHAHVDFLDLAD
jgi:hypothetical protein